MLFADDGIFFASPTGAAAGLAAAATGALFATGFVAVWGAAGFAPDTLAAAGLPAAAFTGADLADAPEADVTAAALAGAAFVAAGFAVAVLTGAGLAATDLAGAAFTAVAFEAAAFTDAAFAGVLAFLRVFSATGLRVGNPTPLVDASRENRNEMVRKSAPRRQTRGGRKTEVFRTGIFAILLYISHFPRNSKGWTYEPAIRGLSAGKSVTPRLMRRAQSPTFKGGRRGVSRPRRVREKTGLPCPACRPTPWRRPAAPASSSHWARFSHSRR